MTLNAKKSSGDPVDFKSMISDNGGMLSKELDMKYYTVRQVAIPASEKDLPNEVGSWTEACEKSIHWKTKLDVQRMSFSETPIELSSEQLACYEDKYLVQAADMEDVFRVTNLWDAPDQVHTYSPGHSTSVGDIIVDNETGDEYIVADFGFNKLAA